MLLPDQTILDHSSSYFVGDLFDRIPSTSLDLSGISGTMEGLDGCNLLHLDCGIADIGMLELLLHYGGNINATEAKDLFDARYMGLYQKGAALCQIELVYKAMQNMFYSNFPF